MLGFDQVPQALRAFLNDFRLEYRISVLTFITLLPDLLKHSTKQSLPVHAWCGNESRRLPNPRVPHIVDTGHAPEDGWGPQHDGVYLIGPGGGRGGPLFVVDTLAQHVPQFGGCRRVTFLHAHALGHGQSFQQVSPGRDVLEYHPVRCVDEDVVLRIAEIARFGYG